MENSSLLQRALNRRKVAAMALRRQAAKLELTPEELREKINKVSKIQSIFGAPKDEEGRPVGRAGRTMAFIENWLKEKSDFGLPPVGDQFKTFVSQEMDRSNYIWGAEEAVSDIARDIAYNFGFTPHEVTLIEQKEQTANMDSMKSITRGDDGSEMPTLEQGTPPQLQPNQGPLNMSAKVRGFTKKAQFGYESPADVDDHTVLPETPVVTREDYREAMESDGSFDKAKEMSEFEKKPMWSFNPRNVGKNDLLHDLDEGDYDKTDEWADRQKQENEQMEEYNKPDQLYPVRGFASQRNIKAELQDICKASREHIADYQVKFASELSVLKKMVPATQLRKNKGNSLKVIASSVKKEHASDFMKKDANFWSATVRVAEEFGRARASMDILAAKTIDDHLTNFSQRLAFDDEALTTAFGIGYSAVADEYSKKN